MLNKILKVLFPSPCLSCGYLSEALCDRCYRRLEFRPHMRETGGMKICSAMYFQPGSILEKLIHPFKYKHQASLFKVFVPHMREALSLLMEPRNLILVPVPLHKKRELERGYNQAEFLAKWVAKHLGCRMMKLLERVKDTGVQAHLSSGAERAENMAGAFRVTCAVPKDGIIVVVDDIVTTGSTLLSCRDVLLSAGAGEVRALTLAERENTWN